MRRRSLRMSTGGAALVGCDLDEADIRGRRVEGMDDGAVLGRRVEPIAGEGNDAKARLGVAEGIGKDTAMFGGEVEVIASARDVEVGIGVEAVDKGNALVAQIG